MKTIGRVTPDFAGFRRDLFNKYGNRCQCRHYATVKGRDILLDQCHVRIDEHTGHLDHCLIRKNKKWRKYINSLEWNWQPSCEACNVGRKTDLRSNRMFWFDHVVEKYGIERIKADLERAPEKMKYTNSDYMEIQLWADMLESEE